MLRHLQHQEQNAGRNNYYQMNLKRKGTGKNHASYAIALFGTPYIKNSSSTDLVYVDLRAIYNDGEGRPDRILLLADLHESQRDKIYEQAKVFAKMHIKNKYKIVDAPIRNRPSCPRWVHRTRCLYHPCNFLFRKNKPSKRRIKPDLVPRSGFFNARIVH